MAFTWLSDPAPSWVTWVNSEDWTDSDDNRGIEGLARAARYCGCRYQRIQYAISTGALPAVKQGRHWYIRREHLDQYKAVLDRKRGTHAPTLHSPAA